MLATKIRSLCRERGISVADLEKAAGLKRNSIYGWDQSIPAVDKVKSVADALGISMDELMREEEADSDG